MKKSITFGMLYILIIILVCGIVHADDCIQPAKNASFGEQCAYMQCSNGVLKYPNLFGSTIKISFSYISEIDPQTYNTDLTNNDIVLIYAKDTNSVKILYGNNVEEETVKKLVGKYSKTFSADPCTGFQESVNDLQKTEFLITPLASEKECAAEFKEIQAEINQRERHYVDGMVAADTTYTIYNELIDEGVDEYKLAKEINATQEELAPGVNSVTEEQTTSETRYTAITASILAIKELYPQKYTKYQGIFEDYFVLMFAQKFYTKCANTNYGAVVALQTCYFKDSEKEGPILGYMNDIYTLFGTKYVFLEEELGYVLFMSDSKCENIIPLANDYLKKGFRGVKSFDRNKAVQEKLDVCIQKEKNSYGKEEAIQKGREIDTSNDLYMDIWKITRALYDKKTINYAFIKNNQIIARPNYKEEGNVSIVLYDVPREKIESAEGTIQLDNSLGFVLTSKDMSQNSNYLPADQIKELEGRVLRGNKWGRILTSEEIKITDNLVRERFKTLIEEKYGK
jgi:hypothetical protein